ncbi:MAG: hypothetical protein VW647_09135, partial [Alphaproteobacteria bacterium]
QNHFVGSVKTTRLCACAPRILMVALPNVDTKIIYPCLLDFLPHHHDVDMAGGATSHRICQN